MDSEMRHRLFVSQSANQKNAPARQVGQQVGQPPAPQAVRPVQQATARPTGSTAYSPIAKARLTNAVPAASGSGIAPEIVTAVAASTVFPVGNDEKPVSAPVEVKPETAQPEVRAVMVESEIDEIPDNTPGTSWGLLNYPLGSVYAPLQTWRNIYSLVEGLSRGTIFEELFLPFEGQSVYKGGAT